MFLKENEMQYLKQKTDEIKAGFEQVIEILGNVRFRDAAPFLSPMGDENFDFIHESDTATNDRLYGEDDMRKES